LHLIIKIPNKSLILLQQKHLNPSKMKIYTYILYCFFLLVFFTACDSDKKEEVGKEVFGINGDLRECLADSVKLYESDGFVLKPLFAVPLTKSGSSASFKLSGRLPQKGFYFIGTSTNNLMPVLLGGEENVKLTGNGTSWKTGVKIEDSPQNEQYQQIMQQVKHLNKQAEDASQMMHLAQKVNHKTIDEAIKKFGEVRFAHQKMIDSLRKMNPYFATVAEMSLFLPLDVENNPKKYPDALTYFVKEYFANINFKDPDLGYMQPYIENVGTYTRTLSENLTSKDTLEMYLNDLLKKMPEKTRIHRLTMAAIIKGLEAQNSGSFAKYTENFAKLYPDAKEVNDQNKEKYVALKATEEQLKKVAIGATPPDLNLPTPEGRKVSLASFKGSIVLIHFWASWSDKSRKDIPNISRLYKKFHAKGFQVISVSLDKYVEKWKEAMDEENMGWTNVSELKQWDSQCVKDYSLSSIPRSFLLDREGKIIAQDPKGGGLEAKLNDFFLPKKKKK